MNWIVDKPIAHRGLHSGDAEIPENSIASFNEAIKHGYPIEIDIHPTTDGKIVVFHDDELDRMTELEGYTYEHSSKELCEASLMGTKEKIPLFSDVLECVDGQVPLLIEMKQKSTDIGTFEQKVIDYLDGYKGEFSIQSFNPLVMKWFVENAPHIKRGMLSGDFRDEDDMPIHRKIALSNYMLNFLSKPDFIAYDLRCLPHIAVSISKRNKPLVAWTVKTEEDLQKAKKLCDNHIFEGLLP